MSDERILSLWKNAFISHVNEIREKNETKLDCLEEVVGVNI
jgi:hypothetical protein